MSAPALRRRAVPLAVAGVLWTGTLGMAVLHSPGREPGAALSQRMAPASLVAGTVQDELGRPVPGARVTMGPAHATTDAKGRFRLDRSRPALATAKAPGHLSRTLVLEPGHPRAITLSSRREDTLALRFGGDIMMGRRFYERTPDHPALLRAEPTAAEQARLLDDVKPLLQDADLTVANLETPLLADPYYDPKRPRPPRFHPTKDLAFGTALTAAKALADSGIGALSLGNNHAFDGLEPGIESTLKALDDAGVAHFGAGRNEAEAWAPAILSLRGHTTALVGCTTVSGEAHPIPYVAGPNRAGAALCEPKRLTSEVAKAKQRAETVVLMIHGDIEYRREQTPLIRHLEEVGRAAGAHLVIVSHPHVIGGLVGGPSSLFAETTGNLIFDQDLWDTFPSYLLRVDVRGNTPVAASADPMIVDGYRPSPAIGAFADAVARIGAGTVPGRAQLRGPGVEITYGPQQPGKRLITTLAAGHPRRLAPGWWVDPTSAQGIRLGTDLLFGTGSMEPLSLGPRAGGGHLWSLGKYGRVSEDGACSSGPAPSQPGQPGAAVRGGVGILLARSPLSHNDVYAMQSHRTPVRPGRTVTIMGQVRRASPGSSLEIKWYAGKEGPSRATSVLRLPTGVWDAHSCRAVRLDVAVPQRAHYAQVFVRLDPPAGGQKLRRLAVDNIRLVEWARKPESGRRFDTVESSNGAEVAAVADSQAVGDDPFLP